MNINPIQEIRKMLELMDKSNKVYRFMWAVLILGTIIALVYLLLNGLPGVINAISHYQQVNSK